jgi:hypothetical protein
VTKKHIIAPVFSALLALVATTPAAAQNTLDDRIRAAQEAQNAEARKRLAAEAALQAPAGMPQVDLSGVRRGQVPQSAPMVTVQPDRIELVQIKGFLDEPAGLEALVYFNGNRFALTQQQRRMPGGWELAAIGPDSVELVKGNERRQLRFVQYFAPAGQAAVPAAQQPAPGAQGMQPVPGTPAQPTRQP